MAVVVDKTQVPGQEMQSVAVELPQLTVFWADKVDGH